MVNKCCVPYCRNTDKTPNVSFHVFTKNQKLVKIWIHNIKRDIYRSKRNPNPFQVTKYTRICSEHFVQGDFDRKFEKHRLKFDAIPSIFPWTRLENSKQPQIGEEALLSAEEVLSSFPETPNKDLLQDMSQSVNDAAQTDAKLHTPLYLTQLSDLEYKKLLTSNIDLQIKYQELQQSCSCSNVITADKATNVNITQTLNTCISGKNQLEFQRYGYFSVESIKHDDREIAYYTGFPNYKIFIVALNMLFDYGRTPMVQQNCILTMSDTSQRYRHILTIENEFFLVLLKLRQNYSYRHLSTLFNVSAGTVSNIFISWINYMYERLGSRDIWPHRNTLFSHYDVDSKASSNIIGSLDTIEFYIQMPSSSRRQSQTYSRYKSGNTFKGLLTVDAKGTIIFVSALFTGAISDNMLLQKSGFKKVVSSKLKQGKLCPGDTFLTDKGFTATALLEPVNINRPVVTLEDTDEFSVNDDLLTQSVARQRVHVERSIGRLKKFKILQRTFPLSGLGSINQIWTVCCLLSNFSNAISTFD